MTFKHLPDGTIAEVLDDGRTRPVATRTDWQRLARLTERDIAEAAASDPDHPGLDDEFWADANLQERSVVHLEPDVAAQFDSKSTELERQVNAILRDYFRTKRAAS